MDEKRVLIIYYSHSSQTRNLVQGLVAGLTDNGVLVTQQQLKPLEKVSFPFGTIGTTLKMMFATTVRKRMAIAELEERLDAGWDLVVLAGPTWSYNPSGPVLSFLDSWAKLLAGQLVLPCISCRGYWRAHYWQLRILLRRCGARVMKPLVFLHPGAEPWRTVGVFLKLAGRNPESGRSWLSRHYRQFGHTRNQIDRARELGIDIAEKLQNNRLNVEDSITVVEQAVNTQTEQP